METITYSNSKNERWVMTVDTELNEVHVTCQGEHRTYDIPNQIIHVQHDKNEYVYIYTDEIMYQFKFEDNYFLVGDKFDSDHEFIGEYAMHVFGEEV